MNGTFRTVLLIGIYCILSFGCKKQDSTQENRFSSEPDSLKRLEIEAIVNNINDTVNAHGLPEQLPFPVFNANDTIDYWTLEGKPARISVSLNYPDKVIWPTFFVDKNELVLVRYRLWSKEGTPFVRETLTYLNGKDIVYCMERRMNLPEDGLPLYLREMPFTECERTDEEIRKDYESYWNTIREYLEENM